MRDAKKRDEGYDRSIVVGYRLGTSIARRLGYQFMYIHHELHFHSKDARLMESENVIYVDRIV